MRPMTNPAFRSRFEERVWLAIPKGLRGKIVYEPTDHKMSYVLQQTYLPDLLLPNGIYVEIKGKLDGVTRRKMLAVKKAHPHKDIRFVFMRAYNKIYKGSRTSYAAWADKNGFPWAEGFIPEEWFSEEKKEY